MSQIHRVLFMGKVLKHAPLLAFLTLFTMGAMFWAYAHELDKVLNVLQAAAILMALFLLALLALKDESLRYKTQPESFDYKVYKALLLAAPGQVGGSKNPYAAYDHESLVSRSILESWDVQKKLVAQGLTVRNVKFEVDTTQRYELPWFLQSEGTTLLRERFNTLSGKDFNGATLSVCDLQFDTGTEKSIRYAMRFGNYFEYLLTNVIPEASVSGINIRSWLEPEKNESLNPLRSSQAENHLGISCMLSTADGYLLLGHRRDQNTVFKGEWSPSVSGAANLETCSNSEYSPGNADRGSVTTDAYTALDFFVREANEEILQVLPGLLGSNPGDDRKQLEGLRFVGATRELIRLGKPEIFFAMRLPHTLEALQKNFSTRSQQFNGVYYVVGGDKTENLGFLAIREDQLFGHLGFDQKGNKPQRRNPYLHQQGSWRRWLADRAHYYALMVARQFLTHNSKAHQWRPVLNLPNPDRPHRTERFVLSESCIVNLLLMRRAEL
jgi:hypothetical protein